MKNYLLQGIFSQELIEAIAMSTHMDLIQPNELMVLLTTKTKHEATTYLNELIRANHKPNVNVKETA